MNDSSNNSFEQQWQDAFENASLTPSESVWEGIDARLPQEKKPSNNFPNSGYIGIALVGLIASITWLKNVTTDIQPNSQPQTVRKKVISQPKNLKNDHQSNNVRYIIQKHRTFVEKNLSSPDNEVLTSSSLPVNEPFVKTELDSITALQPKQAKGLTIDLPVQEVTQEEPYYIEQKKVSPPKKKESILKRVRISGGISINP